MWAKFKRIELTEAEERELKMWAAASGKTERRMSLRARVVLAAAEGQSLRRMAEGTKLGINSCHKWRRRFAESRLEGLKDKSGRGRRRSISQDKRRSVMALACASPADGRARWSIRQLSAASGISVGSVHKILNSGDLKPPLARHKPRP